MSNLFELTEESFKDMEKTNRDKVIDYIRDRKKVLVPEDMSEALHIPPMEIILILCALQKEGGIQLGLRGSVYFVFELTSDIINNMQDDDFFGSLNNI